MFITEQSCHNAAYSLLWNILYHVSNTSANATVAILSTTERVYFPVSLRSKESLIRDMIKANGVDIIIAASENNTTIALNIAAKGESSAPFT